jgi:hypothetical protein
MQQKMDVAKFIDMVKVFAKSGLMAPSFAVTDLPAG